MFQTLNVSVSDEFLAEYRGWRSRRPQWRAFIAGLRDESTPRATLYNLAASAGASMNECTELQGLISRCRSNGPEAARLEQCEREIAASKEALAKCRARLSERGLSITEQEVARREAARAEAALVQAECAACTPRQETAVRAEGRALGIVD
jgi:hypothetical protein